MELSINGLQYLYLYLYRLVDISRSLTEGLCDKDAGTKKPDFVARHCSLMVSALAELTGTFKVAELKVTPSHLVVQPGAL